MDYFAISALINAVTSAVLGVLVFLRQSKSRVYLMFSLFALAVAVWSTFYYFWRTANDSDAALLFVRLFMAAAVFIPFFYFHFVTLFVGSEKRHIASVVAGYVLAIVFSALSFSSLFIEGVVQKGTFGYWPEPGSLFLPFLIAWLFYAVYATTLLFQTYLYASGRKKTQLLLLLLGMSFGYIGGATNYFLWYDIPIPPYGNILVAMYVVMATYAIVRHHLFELKVIIAELIVTGFWILSLLRVAVSSSHTELIINTLFLALTIPLGIFLIRNVQREVEARERVEQLAKKLRTANKRLKRLDEMKSEFVSVASHQLRSPLTSIRGYSSMLLEGSFGKIPKKARKALERVSLSSAFMGRMVEDYLNVSRIEAGKLEYSMTTFNIIDTVSNVVDMFRPKARQAGLSFQFRKKTTRALMVHADKGKVRQIVQNMIDNAIKYTPKGSITVTACGQDNQVVIAVKDSGIGMSQETIKALFKKFYRADNANNVNVNGTGLGLYVAYTMANDMGGALRATSDGEGEGSTFTFTLPLTNTKRK